MKKIIFSFRSIIFCSILVFSFLKVQAQNPLRIHVMSIDGHLIDSILKTDTAGLIVLNFKTDNGLELYADGFVYKRGDPNNFGKIPLQKEIFEVHFDSSYEISTLKHNFKLDLPSITIDPSATYYLVPGLILNPITGNKVLTYGFSDHLSSSNTLQTPKSGDITFEKFKSLRRSQQSTILLYIFRTFLLAANSTFNPIPPRLVP